MWEASSEPPAPAVEFVWKASSSSKGHQTAHDPEHPRYQSRLQLLQSNSPSAWPAFEPSSSSSGHWQLKRAKRTQTALRVLPQRRCTAYGRSRESAGAENQRGSGVGPHRAVPLFASGLDSPPGGTSECEMRLGLDPAASALSLGLFPGSNWPLAAVAHRRQIRSVTGNGRQMERYCAPTCRMCAAPGPGPGLTPATSAPGLLGPPAPHLQCHICAGIDWR